MIKLIASDLDGTLLLNGAQQLNPEIYDLILELKERGIHFAAASGRQIASLKNLFRPVVDEISYIGENGAVCIHADEIISTSEIPRDLGLRIIEAVKNRPGCKGLISCLDTCYVEAGDDEFVYHIRHVVHNDTTVVDKFETIQEPFLKIAFFDSVDPDASADYFQNMFQGEIKVVTSGNSWVDFVPLNSNKGTALKTLLDKLEIDPADAITFGDQQNDIEMLTLAGQSYAMEAASPEVRECADYVTDSVENTLKKILKKIPKA